MVFRRRHRACWLVSSRPIALCKVVHTLVCLPNGENPLGLMSCSSVEGSSPRWIEPVEKGILPCPRRLTCCHGDHDDYVCSLGRVPLLGIDRLGTNTWELLHQARMRVCNYVLSCQALNGVASHETRGPWCLPHIKEFPGCEEGPQWTNGWQNPIRSWSWGESLI
jgi:hypothetical protein